MKNTYSIALPFRGNGTASDKTPVEHAHLRAVELLYDGARGRYLPRDFAIECLHDEEAMALWHIDHFADSVEVLKAGPDHPTMGEFYYDAWTRVLDGVWLNSTCGKMVDLWQGESGDLFLVCNALMSDDEKQNIYGE